MSTWLQNHVWQRRLYILILLAVCAALFFSLGGMRDLWETDEARYAELGREMLDSGSLSHWIIPRLNYVIYLEKPPLYYWLTALSFAVFGVGEAAARFIPALFGTLSVLIAFALGRDMWGDEKSGFWSGLVLATSLMFFVLSRVILVDMVLCFGIILAVWGAWSLRAGKGWGLYAFWVGCAVGFLTKGVLGPGLAVMSIVLFAALAGEWRLLRRLLDWRGPALFVLLTAPWVVAAALLHKGFITYFFWDEQVGRLLTNQHQRFQPWWYFFVLMPGAFFPWITLLPWCVGRTFPRMEWRKPEARPWLLAAVWFLGMFIFFTLSRSKMMHYALPMLPPLALLVGRPLSGVMSWPRGATAPGGIRASLTVLAALCLVVGLAMLVFPAINPDISYSQAGVILFLGPLFMALLALGVYLTRKRAWAAAIAPLTVFALLVLGAAEVAPTLDRLRSVGPLLKPIAAQLRPDDVVATLGDYWHGVAFYTKKRVLVADNWGELDFGRRLDPQRDKWFLQGNRSLLKVMAGDKRVFVIAKNDRWERLHALAQKRKHALPLFPWATAGDKTLFSNRPRS
ncbi:MAG: glycosyltransferase family 39 protein [Deltaproteobacteria bacterium]|nr:glycosyltransferase family 39 protein [Deltaproteobacteria bacterium]